VTGLAMPPVFAIGAGPLICIDVAVLDGLCAGAFF
jgi:hypothetical protein